MFEEQQIFVPLYLFLRSDVLYAATFKSFWQSVSNTCMQITYIYIYIYKNATLQMASDISVGRIPSLFQHFSNVAFSRHVRIFFHTFFGCLPLGQHAQTQNILMRGLRTVTPPLDDLRI